MNLTGAIISGVRQAEGVIGNVLDKATDLVSTADSLLAEASTKYTEAVVEVEKVLSKYEGLADFTSTGGTKPESMTQQELADFLYNNYAVYSDKRDMLNKAAKPALVLIYNLLTKSGAPRDGVNPTPENVKPDVEDGPVNWADFADEVFGKNKRDENPFNDDFRF